MQCLLARSAENGDVELLKELVGCVGVDLDEVDDLGWTALCRAADVGLEKSVALLLNARADVNKPNDVRVTPLHLACYYGNIECVRVSSGVWCALGTPGEGEVFLTVEVFFFFFF